MQLTATLSKEDINEAIGDWLRKKIPQAQEVDLKTSGSGKNFSASADFTMNDVCSAVLETAPQAEVKEETPESLPTKEEDSVKELKEEESAPSQETNVDVQETVESPSEFEQEVTTEVIEEAKKKPVKRKAKSLFSNTKTA